MDDLELILETIDEGKKTQKPSGTELSQKQLSEHYSLYEGYLKSYRKVRSELNKVDRPSSNHTYSRYRTIKESESYLVNAIRLHELYFQNIGKSSSIINTVHTFIKENYKNYTEWSRDFKACALAARGWVLFGYDHYEKNFKFIIMDDHTTGSIALYTPIIVFDAYEHAYMIDFGSDKSKYFDWFVDHIDWAEVSIRIDNLDKYERSING